MHWLLVEEPRNTLAPLPVNTASPRDTSAQSNGELTLRAKVKKSTVSHKLSIRAKDTTANALHAPVENEAAGAIPSPAYPPLRAVLHNTTSHTDGKDGNNGRELNGKGIEYDKEVATLYSNQRVTDGANHTVSVHPPSSAKPQMSSRRTSMARLRQQQQQQQSLLQQKYTVGDEAEPQPDGGASPVPIIESDSNDVQTDSSLRVGVQIYSYRPTFTSLTHTSASSGESSRGTPEKQVVRCSGLESSHAPRSGKVLPNGLSSPSGGTEMGAAPDDAESGIHDADSTWNGCHEPLSSGRYPVSLPQRSFAPQQPADNPVSAPAESNAPCVTNRATAPAPETSAPFHALQFVPPSNQDPFTSPPHSGRSDAGNGGDAASGADNSRAVGAVLVDAESRKRAVTSAKVVKQPFSHTRPQPAAHVKSDDIFADDDELVVCPFALFGCCARGTHTVAAMRGNATLHEHLVAVAGCLRRMKARQQQLEQNMVILQNQVHTQASTLRATTAQLDLLKRERKSENAKRSEHQPGNPSENRRTPSEIGKNCGYRLALTTADVSVSGNTRKSDEDEEENARGTPPAPKGDETRKALPEDVSLREPQVIDYGVEEYDDDEDNEENDKNYKKDASLQYANGHHNDIDEGSYARQLRQRTQSARQLYALRDNLEKKGRAALAKESRPAATSINIMGGTAGDLVFRTNITRAVSAQPRQSTNKAITSVMQRGAGRAFSATYSQRSLPTVDAKPCSADVAEAKRSSIVRPPSAACSYDIQWGACGSTEVSGMSNVPPYQLPNESVSTISSASFDLDYREDDTEVGAMHQQLLCLSTEDAAATTSPPTEGTDNKEHLRAVRSHRSSHRNRRGREDGYSTRSTPSLVSTTYRPSQLTHAAGVVACESVSEAVRDTVAPTTTSPSSTHSGIRKDDQPEAVKALFREKQQQSEKATAEVAAASVDGVRHTVALQRPTLIRKADIVQDKSQHHKTPVILPRATTPTAARVVAAAAAAHETGGTTAPAPPLTTLSAGSPCGSASAAVPTASIMNKAPALRLRRSSTLDSAGNRLTAVDLNDINNTDNAGTPTSSYQATLQAIPNVDEGQSVADVAVNEADRSGTQSATPTHASTAAGVHLHAPPTLNVHQLTAHAQSYHVEDSGSSDYLPETYSTIVVPRKQSTRNGNGEKSSRRSSLSRSRRDGAGATSGTAAAASQRPQHATSLLSTKEAGEFDAGVPLSLPPRRDGKL